MDLGVPTGANDFVVNEVCVMMKFILTCHQRSWRVFRCESLPTQKFIGYHWTHGNNLGCGETIIKTRSSSSATKKMKTKPKKKHSL
jgi:hypothetical protein